MFIIKNLPYLYKIKSKYTNLVLSLSTKYLFVSSILTLSVSRNLKHSPLLYLTARWLGFSLLSLNDQIEAPASNRDLRLDRFPCAAARCTDVLPSLSGLSGSDLKDKLHVNYSRTSLVRTIGDHQNSFALSGIRIKPVSFVLKRF